MFTKAIKSLIAPVGQKPRASPRSPTKAAAVSRRSGAAGKNPARAAVFHLREAPRESHEGNQAKEIALLQCGCIDKIVRRWTISEQERRWRIIVKTGTPAGGGKDAQVRRDGRWAKAPNGARFLLHQRSAFHQELTRPGAASVAQAAGEIRVDGAWRLRAVEGKQTVGRCLMLEKSKVRRRNQELTRREFIHSHSLGRTESPTYFLRFYATIQCVG